MHYPNFKDLLKSLQPHSLFKPTLYKEDFGLLDLSTSNKALNKIDVSSSEDLQKYIDTVKSNLNVKMLIGGYLETRNIYNRSTHFNSSQLPKLHKRNIHLGIDFWIDSGTPILSPLNGTVHSFANNKNFGDYGPTIILQHEYKNMKFYTLYGHLSIDSIKALKIGDEIIAGNEIAKLGTSSVNGDYPPHLHFQIIKDIQSKVGDYPGVCSNNDIAFYKQNCPDPNLLLNLI